MYLIFWEVIKFHSYDFLFDCSFIFKNFIITFLKKIFWLYWVFIAMPGLSLVAANWDYSLVTVHGLLIAAAFLVVEHGLWGTQASVVVADGLSCLKACDYPRPGIKPVSPALADRFPTREALMALF